MSDQAAPAVPSAGEDPYAPRWRQLRRSQTRAAIAVVAAAVIGLAGLCTLPSIITKLTLAMIAGAAAAPFVLALGSQPCPRCKKLFFDGSPSGRVTFTTTRCLHCGIVIGTPKAEAAHEATEPPIRILL